MKPNKVNKKKIKIQNPGPDYTFIKFMSVLFAFLIANHFADNEHKNVSYWG